MGALISTGRFVLPARQVSHVDDGVESAFYSCVRVCVCVYIYIHARVFVCVCGICSMRASTHTMHSLREGFMMSRVQCCLWLFKNKINKKKKNGKVKKRRKKKRNSFFPRVSVCVC